MKIELIPVKGDTRVPNSECPTCKRELSGAASFDHVNLPSPGDWTVCLYCGEILVFNPDMTQRLPTAEELAAARQSPEWPTLVAMQAKFRGAAKAFFFGPNKPRAH